MKKIRLENGLNILLKRMMNTHSVTIGLYIKAGSGYENAKQNGITHLLEHMHFRRLGEISQEELYYRMESSGSDLRGVTYCDFLEFSMRIHPSKLEDGLFIFKNIILADEWSEDEFYKEKQVVINQIREKGNYISIENEAKKQIFQNSPIANCIMGNVDNIQTLELEEVKRYKKQIFNKNNLIICFTGYIEDTTWGKIQEELQTWPLPEGNENKKLVPPQVFHKRKPDIVFLETEDTLLDVNLSFDVGGSSYNEEGLNILNCILGEGTGSNLQRRLRENLGYTSDIYSYLEKYKDFAVLHIRFSTDKKLLKQCLTEIVDIIKTMKEKITSRELDVSLPFYTLNKVFLEDDTAEMNFQMAYRNFILDCGSEKIDFNEKSELMVLLQELAQSIFVPQNTSVVVIGNVKRISKKSFRDILYQL